ncbi:MAG: IclR family transcriptional regulator [Ruminococcaceae bacterium]|nr:IclR family transcriptional regulator [Oscillospiraceae bacterium]
MSNFAPAVDWAVKLIEIIAESDEALGISAISRIAGINKNMVFRVINSLEAAGWVYCEDPAEKKYRLTMRPFQITRKAAERLSINNVATPFVHALWKRHGESTYLGILQEDKLLYIQHFDSVQDVRIAGALGGAYELYCSAPGKVMLAYAPDAYVEDYLSLPRVQRTANTITDADALRSELHRIREQGYALDREEFGNGIICIAAPIFDDSDHVIAAMGCSLSTVNASADNILEVCGNDVIETAREISRCCGHKE